MYVEHRCHRVEEVFARMFVIVDKSLRQLCLVALRIGNTHIARILHTIQAEDVGLHRLPLQQVRQPARADGGQLQNSLDYVHQLACGTVAQRDAHVLGICFCYAMTSNFV